MLKCNLFLSNILIRYGLDDDAWAFLVEYGIDNVVTLSEPLTKLEAERLVYDTISQINDEQRIIIDVNYICSQIKE